MPKTYTFIVAVPVSPSALLLQKRIVKDIFTGKGCDYTRLHPQQQNETTKIDIHVDQETFAGKALSASDSKGIKFHVKLIPQ